MIKDKVIRPLVIATEKVVEYYFPEEKQEALQSQGAGRGKLLHRHSAGSTCKTAIDDGGLSDQDSSELSKIKRRLKRLDINSSSGSVSQKSPQSHKTLKKRRFRQLERHDIFSSSSNSQKLDKKGLKLNEKMLKKASATVDLISQRVKGKNMIQETVSCSFVTNVIELTKGALQQIQERDPEVD